MVTPLLRGLQVCPQNNFATSVWHLTSERCDLYLDLAKASKKGGAARPYYPTRAM